MLVVTCPVSMFLNVARLVCYPTAGYIIMWPHVNHVQNFNGKPCILDKCRCSGHYVAWAISCTDSVGPIGAYLRYIS